MEKKLFTFTARGAESALVELAALEGELQRAGVCTLAYNILTMQIGFLIARLGAAGDVGAARSGGGGHRPDQCRRGAGLSG